MTTLREAAQQALEALERYQVKRQDFDRFADEVTALRAALAEPQEPVTVDQRVVPLVESALQAVAEKIGDQCAVWYGIGARDVEEVLREAVRHGLVHGAALAEPVQEPQEHLLQQALEALLMMRDRYGEYACPACDHADAAVYALYTFRSAVKVDVQPAQPLSRNIRRKALAQALRGMADGFEQKTYWFRPDPLVMSTLRRAADELDKENT